MFWKTKDHEFEEVYTKYKKKVFYTCYRFTRNNSDALEVAQEVFLKISQKLGTLKNKDGISSWVYRITVNMSLNFLKKNYRLKEVSSDDFEAVYKEKGFDEVELKDYFDRVFKKLSPMEKAVLVLREVEGYSYREMAEMLECKEGTVMSRLHNARKKFRVISDLDTVNGGENSD